MSRETTNYGTGRNLIAGPISGRVLPVAADTYYVGMLLEYKAAITVTDGATNTGDGTVTVASANIKAMSGSWTLKMTAALVADLYDPNGIKVVEGIALTDGDATIVKAAGLTFTVTDGAVAFVADDEFTLAVPTTGTMVALADGPLGAIYNGVDEKVYSSAGYANCLVGGDIYKGGIVDASGDALTLTVQQLMAFAREGFYIKEA
jgi:hypothetical protein